jgi:hypothetical protein
LGDVAVRGALLELDRFWIEAYLWQQFPWYAWAAPSPYNWNFLNSGYLLQHSSLFSPFNWDFAFKPEGWENHCKAMGYSTGKPIIIRVILRHKQFVTASWPRAYQDYSIVYEYRPPIRAASLLSVFSKRLRSSRAISIGRSNPNTAGTLGGYLRDLNGRSYLVSCHHVLGPAGTEVYSPGPYEGRQSSSVATVTLAELPPRSMEGKDCNFFAVPTAARLDLAVAELHANASELVPEKCADGVRDPAKMNPYQPVIFCAKESGRVEAQLTGVTIWHELLFEDSSGAYFPYCFGTLFEMSDRFGGNGALARPGDSGAWVIDEVGGMRLWNGMLIARLGSRAYGCYAKFILDACNAHLPGVLSLI